MRGTSWFRVAIPITSTTRPSETQWRISYCLKLIRNHSTYYSKSRPHFNWNFMDLQILPFQLHLPPWRMIFQQEKPFKSRNQRICIWLSISSTFSSISHLVEYPGWVNFPGFRVASIHPFHGWIWEAACHCVLWCGESKDASGQTEIPATWGHGGWSFLPARCWKKTWHNLDCFGKIEGMPNDDHLSHDDWCF